MRSKTMVTVEMRITRSHNRVADHATSGVVIWMEAVSLPRIVAKHNIWFDASNNPGHLRAQVGVGD